MDLKTWLRIYKLKLAISSYHENKVLFLQATPNDQLVFGNQEFDRPMGLWVNEAGLTVATKSYIGEIFTGELNVHEIVGADDSMILVNTKFSCLTKIENSELTPYWIPPFISELVPEDRCHLSGVALRDGVPQYVTACGISDVESGWRDDRETGGIVVDISTNEIICNRLSMPHSPRWYQDKLWLLNSGTGYFGFIEDGAFNPLVLCPGFTRGLLFWQSWVIVGISKFRSLKGFPVENTLKSLQINPICGLVFIDLSINQIIDTFEFQCDEIFDIAVLF